MARAILTPRRPGLQPRPSAPGAQWLGHRVAGVPVRDFTALTGLEAHPAWPLLYPHAVAFRLQMVVLTDRRFPLPIWNSLQIRNRLVLHRAFAPGATLDFDAGAVAQRVLDKGAEIDLRCTARAGGELLWESTNTFYYRGRFAGRDEAPRQASAPTVAQGDAMRWTLPAGGGMRCGRLTGDYNGIHLSDGYARRFGFRGAFQHPQRVVGECLARLPRPAAAQPLQLEVWLKGPVYYGAEVELRHAPAGAGRTFALHVGGDPRPAVVGRLGGGAESG